jgi:hypothetical protein
MNATALNQYNSLLDAADNSYNATMAQAYSEWTSCATSGLSAVGSIGTATVGLKQMSDSAAEMKSLKAQRAFFNKPENDKVPVNPNVRPNDGTVVGHEEIADALTARQSEIKAALDANKGKLSRAKQDEFHLDENGRRPGRNPNDPLNDDEINFDIAKYEYNNEKIKAIDDAMLNTGPGRLGQPPTERTWSQYFKGQSKDYSLKGKNAAGEEVNYGEIDVHNDPIAQYGLQKSAFDMHGRNSVELKGAQDKLDGHITDANNKYEAGKTLVQYLLPIGKEVMSSIENGIKGMFTQEKAVYDKEAALYNAQASLFKSASDQFSALQSTWSSLNSKYYDQAMSMLPNQMAALVKANSLN